MMDDDHVAVRSALIARLLPADGVASLAGIAAASGRCTVMLVTRAAWGRPHAADGGRRLVLPDGIVLATTQDALDPDVVRHQLGICDAGLGDWCLGRPKVISVHRRPSDPPMAVRLFDGHHALAARLLAGLPLEASEHGPGATPIDPPRLVRRT